MILIQLLFFFQCGIGFILKNLKSEKCHINRQSHRVSYCLKWVIVLLTHKAKKMESETF